MNRKIAALAQHNDERTSFGFLYLLTAV